MLNQVFKKLLHTQEHVIVQANGRSMFPLIVPRNKVVVPPVDLGEIRTGMIVVFFDELKGAFIAHRVLENKPAERLFLCQGDSRMNVEEVNYKYVLGEVTAIERAGVWFSKSHKWWRIANTLSTSYDRSMFSKLTFCSILLIVICTCHKRH